MAQEEEASQQQQSIKAIFMPLWDNAFVKTMRNILVLLLLMGPMIISLPIAILTIIITSVVVPLVTIVEKVQRYAVYAHHKIRVYYFYITLVIRALSSNNSCDDDL